MLNSLRRSYKIFILTGLVIAIGIAALKIYSRFDHDGGGNQAEGIGRFYKPKLVKTIELGKLAGKCGVTRMTFSPDSRYLAIVLGCIPKGTDIIVWDMQMDKMQSNIHSLQGFGIDSERKLLWNHGGNVISFGAKQQWNPMTGEVLPDNPAVGRMARLNKDGSKMFTVVGNVLDPSTIHIYETSTWALQKFYIGEFQIGFAAWTAEDKILIGANVTKSIVGKEVYGRICKRNDVILLLLDPLGKNITQTMWFPETPSDNPKSSYPYDYSFPYRSKAISNFVANKIFLGAGKIIDGVTLKVENYHAKDGNDIAPGAFGMAFADNGNVLYLKGASFKHGGHHPIKNSAIDITSGKLLAEFSGALDCQGSLATSPDGTYLALGDVQSVLIYRLQ